MQLPDDVEELHLIAEYHNACRALRRTGWGGVVWGIINLGVGTAFAFYVNPINALLALIGMFLLASGIWCLALPGAEGIIANGIALILVGLWNIFITLLNFAAGATPQVWWIALGVFFIVAAVQSFQKYARFSTALRHGASEDELAMMDKLVKTIVKANAKTDDDLVTFHVPGFRRQKAWRGLLCRSWAAFYENVSKEMVVASKEQVSIEPHGKVLLGQTLKAAVRIRDYKAEALISPTAFDRFRDWKFSEDENYGEDEVNADEREPETGIRPKDDRDAEPPTGIKRRRPRPEDDESSDDL